MSKKKKKKSNKYSLNNPDKQNFLSLRDELHKALAQEQFIVEIPIKQNEVIEITEDNPNSKIKKVRIEELNFNTQNKVERIWKINLEKDISGITTRSRTPECAILILQKYESSYCLAILLVELKSVLDDKKLEEIEKKFSCAMTRLYMLLVLNNHLSLKQGYSEKTIYITFTGLLFYKQSKCNSDCQHKIYKILQTEQRSGVLTCQTILKAQDKIKVKCFMKRNSDEIIVSLKDLL